MLSRNIHKLSEMKIAGGEAEEHRRGGRFGMVDVHSSHGRVLDLSHCGAMVVKKRLHRTPTLATFPVMIKHKGTRVALTARLARKQRVKGVGLVLGLEFVHVSPEQREKIKEIITHCRHWNVLPGADQAA